MLDAVTWLGRCPLRSEGDRIAARQRNDAKGQAQPYAPQQLASSFDQLVGVSIEPAGSVPFRELYDSAVGIVDVKLSTHNDAFLAILFLEDIDPLGGKEGLGVFVPLRLNFECVMRPATVFRITLKGRIALRENDIVIPGTQKHRAGRGRGLHER